MGIMPIIPNEVGSGYVPRFVSAVIFILAAALLVLTLLGKKMGATEKTDEDIKGGIFTVLLPVSAAVVGMLVLGEQISSLQLLALGIALLGVVVATWPARRPA